MDKMMETLEQLERLTHKDRSQLLAKEPEAHRILDSLNGVRVIRKEIPHG